MADPVTDPVAEHDARCGEEGRVRSDTARGIPQPAAQVIVQARILLGLGEFSLACGNPAEAVAHCREARRLFRSIGAPFLKAPVLDMLSDAHAAEGDQPAARATAETRALSR
jgi:tetratricopeptide repeat protein